MYRTIIKSLVPLLLLLLAQTTQAAQWKEGVQYQEIPFPVTVETGKKIEVREFFWYGCPHCFHMEPTVRNWLKNKPKNAEFVRSPAVLGPSWQLGATAFFTYQALGVVKRMHQATFDAIHVEQRIFSSLQDYADFAAEHGINRDEFMKTTRSFGVQLKLKHEAELDREAGIHSVPTFVIDGKYRTDESLAGSKENLVKLINYLVQKAQKERKQK
ncbi:MAG: thiol:disulfide interchange protein DsbA/DsbL [Acidiferrobacterales bacterium]|jgi:thiol:disulfide interchange protein DsbA|nr:thiol:disulfide interchange protein DsbA/DsbL [Acidiferrobacterales bacterium]